MLANFWAELVLFIAPSDDVEAHRKIIDKGELITQLWALLSHAGILTRPKITLEHAATGDLYYWNTDTKFMQHERNIGTPVTRPGTSLIPPPPWKELKHTVTGILYFWNPETKVLQYDRPANDDTTPSNNTDTCDNQHDIHQNDHEIESEEITVENVAKL